MNNDKTKNLKTKDTKFLFITGGVLSGLGKGVSAAAIGRTLKARGFKIFVQKFDPYYNVDPGTMSPYQHGEVFVTVDGGETDLDLGHYERFIDETLTKLSNYTQGKLMQELLEEERKGVYGGSTIQVIPHVTNKIINKLQEAAKISNADFIITEIGGTVGDIESLPFFQAIWEFSQINQHKSFFIHCAYLPFLEVSEEFKSKPIQHSVKLLHSMGINPNMILLRANQHIPEQIVDKVSKTTFIKRDLCIPVPNVENIYKLPLYFEQHQIAQNILKYFNLKERKANLKDWQKYLDLFDQPKHKTLNIAMIGKYVEFEDAYKSLVEALKISANYNHVNIKLHWISSDKITLANVVSNLTNIDGVVILPGFGKRGFLGKVIVAKYTRQQNIPTFGICYGFQAMVIAQAEMEHIKNPTSSEIDSKGTFVIDIIKGKKKHDNLGGTLRLGLSETKLIKNSLAAQLYKKTSSWERHRHRYEVNPLYVKKLSTNNFVFSGFDALNHYAEVCEVTDQTFYLGVQAHPEFNANPLREHPLFRGFIKAMISNNGQNNN